MPKQRGIHSPICSPDALAEDRRHRQRGAHDRHPDPGVAPEQLLVDDRQRQAGGVGEELRQPLEAVQPDLGGLLDDRPRGLLPLVPLVRGGAHDVGGEAVDPVADVLLVLAQLQREVASWPAAPRSPRRRPRRASAGLGSWQAEDGRLNLDMGGDAGLETDRCDVCAEPAEPHGRRDARQKSVSLKTSTQTRRRQASPSGSCQASSSRVSASTSLGSLPAATSATRDVLEHFAQVRAQRDPDLLQRLGRADVLDLLGPLPAHAHERPLDRPNHLREVDLLGGRASQ